MSFLFTFTLPKLPFPNPFAGYYTPNAATNRQPDWSNNWFDADAYGTSQTPTRTLGRRPPPSLAKDHSYDEQPVSKKRKKPMSSIDEGYSYNTGRPRADARNHLNSYDFIDDATPVQTWPTAPGGGPACSPYARYPSTYTSITPDEHAGSRYRDVPERQGDYGEDDDYMSQRPAKRQKTGIAETIISTAISVALVSTAVGYTAYKLWRDRGKPSTIEAPREQDKELKEDAEDSYTARTPPRQHQKRRPRLDEGGSLRTSGLVSPPPPYSYLREEADEDGYVVSPSRAAGSSKRAGHHHKNRPGLGYDTFDTQRASVKLSSPIKHSRGGSGGGGYVKVTPKRSTMAKVHRKLGGTSGLLPASTSVGDGSSSLATRLEAEETAVSPSSSISRSKPLWKEDDGLDEDSQLELQMDWMSERLRGLIADGQKALGREIVLPEHERPDVGIVDDGDGGWVDY
ncbi:hypothetical protein CPB86DRAFT_794564 [Serendipita vermifera]|nr:hypothetical protein CPB86DRAFT_794564 [Serendipita vermifera]